MYCTNCGKEMRENQAICTACGFRANAGNEYCSHCGRKVNKGQAICVGCGFRIKPASPTVTRTVPPATVYTPVYATNSALSSQQKSNTATMQNGQKHIASVRKVKLLSLFTAILDVIIVLAIFFLPMFEISASGLVLKQFTLYEDCEEAVKTLIDIIEANAFTAILSIIFPLMIAINGVTMLIKSAINIFARIAELSNIEESANTLCKNISASITDPKMNGYAKNQHPYTLGIFVLVYWLFDKYVLEMIASSGASIPIAYTYMTFITNVNWLVGLVIVLVILYIVLLVVKGNQEKKLTQEVLYNK